jgi:hypothetical protein
LEESCILELLLECGLGGVYFKPGYDWLAIAVTVIAAGEERREIRPGYAMGRRPAIVISSSLSQMMEESCLFGGRRRVHDDEESYVVVHCGVWVSRLLVIQVRW